MRNKLHERIAKKSRHAISLLIFIGADKLNLFYCSTTLHQLSIMSSSSSSTALQTYTPGKLDFPSDHFPIVMRLGDAKGIGIMSFNTLNEAYKEYIHYGQSLKGSRLDQMTEEQRHNAIIEIIAKSFENGVAICALQEVSNKLMSRLFLAKLVIVQTPNMDGDGTDNGCVLLNPKLVKINGTLITSAFNSDSDPDNYIQQIPLRLVSDPKQSFTLVNTHVKFGCIKQLIHVLKQIGGPIISLGDFNVGFNDPRKESSTAPLSEEKEFNLWLDHAPFSHVNTLQTLDLFDHFYTKDVVLIKDPELLDKLRQKLVL